MRKIDKNCGLSTVYSNWVKDLEDRNEAHPKYTHSKTREDYYLDIVMQLHHCQDGLCAYTERRLCTVNLYQPHLWENGKYKALKPSSNIEGHLDHFDPSLKSKKNDAIGKKDWLWDNFFVIHGEINTRVKGEKGVNKILKPDEAGFDPSQLLDYNLETHSFTPNKALDEPNSESVKLMLETLGVNYFNDRRRSYLMDKLRLIFLNIETWDSISLDEFPTAFEMCKEKVQQGEVNLEDLLAV
jgi:hypothetical protein